MLSVVMDGKDGNGLKLEKNLANLFKFSSCVLRTVTKNDHGLLYLPGVIS